MDSPLDDWEWLQQAELINLDNLANDGMGDDCKNSNDGIHIYNKGALIELASATGDDPHLDPATDIANAIIATGSPLPTERRYSG